MIPKSATGGVSRPIFDKDGFAALTFHEKRSVLDHILSIASRQELIYVKGKINEYLSNDFLRLLPSEISSKICGLLDPQTLSRCCLVCRGWNAFISSENCAGIWKQYCQEHCINIYGSCEQSNFKMTWTKGKEIFLRLSNGIPGRFSAHTTLFHFASGKNILGKLSYLTCNLETGEIVAACGDRSLCISSIDTGEVKCLQEVPSRLSCIKACSDFLACGTFDGQIYLYECQGNSVTKVREHRGHTGAVSCIDIAKEHALVVSGSTDSSLKIWSHNKYPLFSVDIRDQGVTEVVVLTREGKELVNSSDLLIVSKSKSSIMVTSFSPESLHFSTVYKRFLLEETCPGLCVVDSSIVFGLKRGNIVVSSLETGKEERSLETEVQLNSIVAAGSCFVVTELKDFTLGVFNLRRGTKQFSFRLYRLDVLCSHRVAVYSGTNWLSGIDPHLPETFLLFYPRDDSSIGSASLDIVPAEETMTLESTLDLALNDL